MSIDVEGARVVKVVVPISGTPTAVQELELVEGSNVTLTASQSGARVELTIAASGGGGGAPTNAQYVTLATDATLSNESVLTASTSIALDTSTPGTVEPRRAALTGDVTASANSNSTTIANDAVTFAKMQNIATDSLVGRDTAGTGDPENVTLGTGLEMDGAGALRVTSFLRSLSGLGEPPSRFHTIGQIGSSLAWVVGAPAHYKLARWVTDDASGTTISVDVIGASAAGTASNPGSLSYGRPIRYSTTTGTGSSAYVGSGAVTPFTVERELCAVASFAMPEKSSFRFWCAVSSAAPATHVASDDPAAEFFGVRHKQGTDSNFITARKDTSGGTIGTADTGVAFTSSQLYSIALYTTPTGMGVDIIDWTAATVTRLHYTTNLVGASTALYYVVGGETHNTHGSARVFDFLTATFLFR